MKFTKEDAYTFLIGWAMAAGLVLAESLLSASDVEDWPKWGVALGTGTLAATGRYLKTYLLGSKGNVLN